MKGPPVSAKRLHGRTLRIGSRPPVRGSVFPFFDRDGAVSAVMVTTADSSEIFAAPWEPRLVQAPWFGTIRIGHAAHTLSPLREDSVDMLASRWHFDPWWVLAEPPYQDHWAVQILKRTNAVTELQTHDIKSVYFSRDLSRVCAVGTRKGDNESFRRWKPSWLGESVPSLADESARGKKFGR